MGAMMLSAWRAVAVSGLLGVLLLVQGCREDEQDRVLVQEKGVYQGEQDDGLDFEQLEELRARTSIQKF